VVLFLLRFPLRSRRPPRRGFSCCPPRAALAAGAFAPPELLDISADKAVVCKC
jgi:hypothetical protein